MDELCHVPLATGLQRLNTGQDDHDDHDDDAIISFTCVSFSYVI
jgi:hypothetical protein